MLSRHETLAGALMPSGRNGVDGARGLKVGQLRGWSLVEVAAFSGCLVELQSVARSLMELELPATIGDACAIGRRFVFKTAPTQFWILSRDSENLEIALRFAVGSAVGAVTSISHSRARLFIEGAVARQTLATGFAIDLHPKVFRCNSFALTGLCQTPVLLHRTDQYRYEMYVMQSYANCIWEWLVDAALPFGYDVLVDEPG